jgi:S-formylglutathione hydrolase FrmB
MFTAFVSMLGGSAFRAIWGEVSDWFTTRQNHKHEIERIKAQEAIDAAAHSRNLESLRLQNDLGIKLIEVQGAQTLNAIEGSAWSDIVASTAKSTGIWFIDAWNGSIRPLLATLAIAVVVAAVVENGFVMTDWDKDLMAAILGIYLADRSLSKRGK